MGTTNAKPTVSELLYEKIVIVFNMIDTNRQGSIDEEQTLKFWKSNFPRVNTEALFRAVALHGSRSVSLHEWFEFWLEVKNVGYSEIEISDELDNLIDGFSWVNFDRMYDGKRRTKNSYSATVLAK